MSSGDSVVAGEVTTCETTTDLIGALPNPPDVPFNGVVVFRVGPQPGDLAPEQTLDGIHGIGANGAPNNGSLGGSGVTGFGGPNQGPGVVGIGGGITGSATGGTGVEGRGGRGFSQSNAPPAIEPGSGIVGHGGQQDPFETTGQPHGAGVVGIAGNGPFPSFVEVGSVGVYGQGGNADRVTGSSDGTPTINGPTIPGIGVLGRGATQSLDSVEESPTGAGVVGVSGHASLATLDEFGDVGVLGKSRDGSGVVGLATGKPGVFGRADSAAGVFGSSEKGVGVAGNSDGSNGGYFSSERVAQVHLEPLRAPLDNPNGKIRGRGGDLLTLKNRRPDDLPSDVVFRAVSLWFCQSSGGETTAVWTKLA